jgi:hypothetical protein
MGNRACGRVKLNKFAKFGLKTGVLDGEVDISSNK